MRLREGHGRRWIEEVDQHQTGGEFPILFSPDTSQPGVKGSVKHGHIYQVWTERASRKAFAFWPEEWKRGLQRLSNSEGISHFVFSCYPFFLPQSQENAAEVGGLGRHLKDIGRVSFPSTRGDPKSNR